MKFKWWNLSRKTQNQSCSGTLRTPCIFVAMNNEKTRFYLQYEQFGAIEEQMLTHIHVMYSWRNQIERYKLVIQLLIVNLFFKKSYGSCGGDSPFGWTDQSATNEYASTSNRTTALDVDQPLLECVQARRLLQSVMHNRSISRFGGKYNCMFRLNSTDRFSRSYPMSHRILFYWCESTMKRTTISHCSIGFIHVDCSM